RSLAYFEEHFAFHAKSDEVGQFDRSFWLNGHARAQEEAGGAIGLWFEDKLPGVKARFVWLIFHAEAEEHGVVRLQLAYVQARTRVQDVIFRREAPEIAHTDLLIGGNDGVYGVYVEAEEVLQPVVAIHAATINAQL